jgi:hypothetical protein
MTDLASFDILDPAAGEEALVATAYVLIDAVNAVQRCIDMP